MIVLKLFPALLCLLAGKDLAAADWSSLYDRSKLEAEKPRLQTALDYLIEHEIKPFIPEGQRVTFGLQSFDLPITTTAPDPVGVYAENRHVELPVRTLLFVEELSRAYGWLWTNRCTTKTVDEYLTMLRYRKPEDFGGGRFPSPLEALHIPSNALNDPKVVEMSLRARRTAFAFLLLHEYAHLHLEPAPSEQAADAYALDRMKSNSAPPIGLLVVMQSWLLLDGGNPAAQHPVTARRLEAMAQYLDAHLIEFVQGRPNVSTSTDVIHSLAILLREDAEFMGIAAHEQETRDVALKTDVAALKPRPLPKATR